MGIIDDAEETLVMGSGYRDSVSPQLATTAEAVAILRVSARALYDLRERGLLPYVKVNRRIKYAIDDLAVFVNRGRLREPLQPKRYNPEFNGALEQVLRHVPVASGNEQQETEENCPKSDPNTEARQVDFGEEDWI